MIVRCLSGYLIKNCYYERKNRIKDFSLNEEKTKIKHKNELIFLRSIGMTDSSVVNLCYIIEREELCVVKSFNNPKLERREIINYKRINCLFLPKLYGIIKDGKHELLVIEFIQGRTLQFIKEFKLTIQEKLKIIFEILFAFHYLHYNGFIYRDLKPNNIIIDRNHHMCLIDFDRMIILKDTEIINSAFTSYFNSSYVAPEIITTKEKLTSKCDVYSIGKIIYFILMEKELIINSESKMVSLSKEFSILSKIITDSTSYDAKDRPSMDDLIKYFCDTFQMICFDLIVKDIGIQNYITIKENQNDPIAHKNLGIIYYEGSYITRDIQKAIHHLSIASQLNNHDATCFLSKIYFDGDGVEKDINKAISLSTIAAKNMNSVCMFKKTLKKQLLI